MKAKDKKDWIDALRSGKYKQGREYLRRDDTYCCLGVLCDLHLKWENVPGLPVYGIPITHEDKEIVVKLWTTTLPSGFVKRIKINEYIIEDLIRMNDTEEKNFHEIADWIEQNIKAEND